MRFAVAHVINSPAGAVKTARLVIEDVPEKTTIAEVTAAVLAGGGGRDKDGKIQGGYAQKFAEGGIPLGNHEIVGDHGRGRSGWPKGLLGVDSAPTLAWSRLITRPKPNETPRMTLRLSPAEHTAFTLAAERAGLSLQSWAVEALALVASNQHADLSSSLLTALRAERAAEAAAPSSAGAS